MRKKSGDGPLVTVYITNHNYGRYIKKAIDSVLNQKFKDFELIIIDDGSVDHSRGIIESYRNNPAVKIVYQQNKGLNVSGNIATNLSRGRYIMRLDADDYLDENALLIMTTTMEKDGGISMAYPDYYLVDEQENVFAHERRHNFQKVSVKDRPAHGACTMIRKNDLIEVGGYYNDLECQDGYDLWTKFVNRFKVVNINLPLFYYRQHDNNLTKDQEKMLATRHEIIKRSVNIGEIKKKSHVAIVPIRGRDAERPLAIRKFADTTPLDITLGGCLKSENISKIILTTPDDRIIKYAKIRYKNRIIIDKRPEGLSAFNMKLENTIDHLLEKYNKYFGRAGTISLINFEYPLRKSIYIDKAINSLYLYNAESVLSVKQLNANFYKHEGSGLVPFKTNKELRLERDIVFEETGGIHVIGHDSYLKKRSLGGSRIGHIVIDELSAMKIADGMTFKIAEYLYRNSNAKK